MVQAVAEMERRDVIRDCRIMQAKTYLARRKCLLAWVSRIYGSPCAWGRQIPREEADEDAISSRGCDLFPAAQRSGTSVPLLCLLRLTSSEESIYLCALS
jgi:hypothetical protein